MNRSRHSITHALFALLLFALAVGEARALEAVGYIARLKGQVTIDGDAAERGSPFNPGALIRTAEESYALLKFKDEQTVFLRSNTELKVDAYVYEQAQPQQNNSSLSLLKGGMRAVTGLIGKDNPEAVRYDTPAATIGIRGTELMASLVRDVLFVRVLSGAIHFPDGRVTGIDLMRAGEDIALSPTGAVLATGGEARSMAEQAGAYTNMNTVRMDTSASQVRDWGQWRTEARGGGEGKTEQQPTEQQSTEQQSTEQQPAEQQPGEPAKDAGSLVGGLAPSIEEPGALIKERLGDLLGPVAPLSDPAAAVHSIDQVNPPASAVTGLGKFERVK